MMRRCARRVGVVADVDAVSDRVDDDGRCSRAATALRLDKSSGSSVAAPSSPGPLAASASGTREIAGGETGEPATAPRLVGVGLVSDWRTLWDLSVSPMSSTARE